MRNAVLIDVVRSPFGRGRDDGVLAGIHPVDLYAQVLSGLMARNELSAELIEDVISGCVMQVGEQAGNIGRQAALAAGFPESVPAVTLDRKCGSAQQAMDFAAQGVIAGAYDAVIAGGVEMMSRIKMKSNRLGRDSEGPMYRSRYPEGSVHQGVAAELVARRWSVSREESDRYALASHRRAAQAEDAGISGRYIVPIQTPAGDTVTRDEGLRRDTTIERLRALKTPFRSDEMAARFPDLDWTITAGNASQVSDGASACLIMEETLARSMGLEPLARIRHFALAGVSPIEMLSGVIPATKKLLARAGVTPSAVDAFEVNEAFASVVLAWCREFSIAPEQVNTLGGAIALGHPVGASGGRLIANLLASLEAVDGELGLLTMCESGGMANATMLQRL